MVRTKPKGTCAALTAATLFLMLMACASRPPRASAAYEQSSSSSASPLTPQDVELTSEVGDVIYTHGVRSVLTVDSVQFKESGVAPLEEGHVIKVSAGQSSALMRRNPGGQRAVCLSTLKGGGLAKIVTGFSPSTACLVDSAGDGTFDVAAFKFYERTFPVAKPIPYEIVAPTKSTTVLYGGVRRELVYGGATNGSLRLSYREFTEQGYARPSFTQEVMYALEPNGQAEVGFKGLRIQVISATNSRITYRVLKAMD